ncbi:MAG: hydrogen peroxide-dependent heme synthase [Gemmatimonadaceae bacterium]
MDQTAHPPETVEGWYALHQLFTFDRPALRAVAADELERWRESAVCALREIAGSPGAGWSAGAGVVGSRADLMLIHFRPTLDEIGVAQRRLQREPFFDFLRPAYSFLSVTEAALYHATAELAKAAEARGGNVGDAAFERAMAERVEAELASAHVQRRLYPPLPTDMPYVCFYPMSKKRESGQNWYALPLTERSALMQSHGLTGRKYAGRIMQVIAGAIGLDAWEWGVTLFARDPLDFKKIVTEMRFDEASAKYATFGDFYVGRIESPEDWVQGLT